MKYQNKSLVRWMEGILLMLTVLRSSQGMEYHVDQRAPGANDQNPGTAEQPFKTISAAVKAVVAGDTIWIHTGTYREKVTISGDGTAEKPITIAAAPAAEVVVSGTDRLTAWTPEPDAAGDSVFSTAWPHVFINWTKRQTQPDDERHVLIGRCEQVLVQGYPLRQVLKRGAVTRGTFFVDSDAKRLYACAADNADLRKEELHVEAATRFNTWVCKGRYVHLRGVRFRYGANMAQHGAAEFEGAHGKIEDCVFERTTGAGAVFNAENLTVQRCVFQENGQLGFRAERAHKLRLSDCVCRNNNVKNYERGWEAGGNKLVLCRGVVVERSTFCDNRGLGLWFDIGNEDCEVKNCLIVHNEEGGLFYEISYGLHAHDNVILGNGLTDSAGAWGMEAGISVSSSPGCVIERNLLIGNREGFDFREAERTTPRIDDPVERFVWNHDEVIRANVLAYNRDAQVWGWFDQKDERHWPAAMQSRDPQAGGNRAAAPDGDAANAYAAKSKEGAPLNLTLEALKIVFENNVLYAEPGQGLFNWGVAWGTCKRYANLDEMRTELAIDRGSVVAQPEFADYFAGDLRVADDSVLLDMRCYPQKTVPGVTLGRIPRRKER